MMQTRSSAKVQGSVSLNDANNITTEGFENQYLGIHAQQTTSSKRSLGVAGNKNCSSNQGQEATGESIKLRISTVAHHRHNKATMDFSGVVAEKSEENCIGGGAGQQQQERGYG